MPQNKCACGCGEWLTPNAKRAYKRGHAPKPSATSQPKPAEETPFNPFETIDPQPSDPFEDLIASLPDDPEPDQVARDKASGIIKPDGAPVVTKQIARHIQGNVAFLLSMPAAMLQSIDPYCMPMLLQQTPEISARLTPIICQSPDMVKFFTKTGGGFVLWLNLAVSCWPVVQVAIAHHISKSVGHDHKDENGVVRPNPQFTQYQA